MSDWTSGYVADINYTYGYYGELNPLRASWVLATQCIAAKGLQGDGVACELGFGQGISANIHASASQAQWWGTDFNPSQAGFARELEASYSKHQRFFDQSFSEFCNRPDLPEFDYIGLHGIWTWVSDENRAAIVDFVRRKLKVGGVLYVSYNVQPGWSAGMPLRHLFSEHARIMGAPGDGSLMRVTKALDFTNALFDLNPRYLQANPSIKDRLNHIKDLSKNYLAHEYFNRDWHPMYFSEVADLLATAKLEFAGSAHFQENVDALNVTADQRKMLAGLHDPRFRETVRDFCTANQFRRDLWIKGARRISGLDAVETIRNFRFVLAQLRSMVQLTTRGLLGEVSLVKELYEPVLDALADHAPRSFGEIEKIVSKNGIGYAQLVEILTVLLGTNAVALCQDPHVAARARPQTDKLNQKLIHLARSNQEISWLASPVLGGGFQLNRIQLLFLGARNAGAKSPNEWAQVAWQILAAQNQKLTREGAVIEDVEENQKILQAQAQGFADGVLPIAKAVGVA